MRRHHSVVLIWVLGSGPFGCFVDRPVLTVSDGGTGPNVAGVAGAGGSTGAGGSAGSLTGAAGNTTAPTGTAGVMGMAGGQGSAGAQTIHRTVSQDLDIVFEVDDSVSMQPEQANLVANFPVFTNALKNLPGGLPNVHIGVVTSDMGAGAFSASVGGCENPDNGVFIDQVRAATDPVCGTATLNKGEHFIVSSNDGAQNNFTGDITDVFRCLAEVGTTGCGFESHLESVRAALGDLTGDPSHDIPLRVVPPNNVGFLRPDAYLAVIFITNEEECSTSPDNVLFDPSTGADAALGSLPSRCFAHTDICDGKPVVDYVQAGNPVGPFQSCIPDETTFGNDPTHGPIPVQYYVDFLKGLKADPSQVLVSGIIAPAGPYSLVLSPTGQGTSTLLQGNSCTGAAGVFGQPVPRWTKFFGGFDTSQVVTSSICDSSFANAMAAVAAQLTSLMTPCIPSNIASVMGPNGLRPDCSVVDHSTDARGSPVTTQLPYCPENGGQAPCWSLTSGSMMLCLGQQVVQIARPTSGAPSGVSTSVDCSAGP
jgi:hypothetical protein